MTAKRSQPQRSTTVQAALTAALKDVEVEVKDGAAVALARRYAKAIDEDADPAQLRMLGSKLLDVLIELRMTPKARFAVIMKEGPGDGGGADPREDALDALTREHVERQG